MATPGGEEPLIRAGRTWPVVGRLEELEYLAAALAGPAAGAVLVGEAGVGKSRLAREVLERAGAGGAATEWIGCTASASVLPFGAFGHLLAPAATNELAPGASAMTVIESELVAKAGERPLVIAVDDAHLLDPASAGLVLHLASTARAKVICTVRKDGAPPDAVVALWKDGLCDRLDVQPLSAKETAELVEVVLAGHVEAHTREWLWELSTGNVLLLRELLIDGIASNQLADHDGVWRWVGPLRAGRRLQDLVGAHLDGLTDAAQDAVLVLALAEPIDVGVFTTLVGADVATELERAGAIRMAPAHRSADIGLSHPLYGEVMLASAPVARRRRLVADMAAMISSGGAASAQMARRVAAQCLDLGVEVPVVLAEIGGAAAGAAGDTALAVTLGESIPDDRRGFDTRLMLATAYFSQRRFDDTEAFLDRLADDADTDARRALVARLAISFGQLGRHQPEAARQAARRALATIEDPIWRDFVRATWAQALAFGGSHREAGEISIPLLESADERVRLRALSAATTALIMSGRSSRAVDNALGLVEASLRHAGELPAAPFWAVSSVLYSTLTAGRLEEMAQWIELVASTGAVAHDTEAPGLLALLRGRLALGEGRARTAFRQLSEAVVLMNETDVVGRISWAYALQAESASLIGDVKTAAEALREQSARFEPTTSIYQGDARRALAWGVLSTGDREQALDVLFATVDAAWADGDLCTEMHALHDAARLGAASRVASRLEALVADGCDDRWIDVYAKHARALVENDAAALEQVAVEFEARRMFLLAAEAATEAAVAFHSRSVGAGVTRSLERADRLRASCEGVSTPALDNVPNAIVLTDREREIATLVADGASSRDVAEQLDVSVRTVSNHLQRAYDKLGVHDRIGLAEVLGRTAPGD